MNNLIELVIILLNTFFEHASMFFVPFFEYELLILSDSR
jgi:hypothetical protein